MKVSDKLHSSNIRNELPNQLTVFLMLLKWVYQKWHSLSIIDLVHLEKSFPVNSAVASGISYGHNVYNLNIY